MLGIERRAKRELFLFTIVHPERYTSLEDYRSENPAFRELLMQLVPEGWQIGKNQGIWCSVRPPGDQTSDGGFKIHVSTTHEKAGALLDAVVPILVAENVAFKVLVDEPILDFNNSSYRSSGSCGKFITIYPEGVDQFRRLIERLHVATRDFEGPYILSDKRYKESKVLFYRYGAFKNAPRVNVYGEPEPYFRAADGRFVPDTRSPYFELPEGIDDPFPDEDDAEGDAVLMNGRYRATKSMGSSAKGGVYRAIDMLRRVEVVIKEARPHVNRGHTFPHDAVDCLKNEHAVLERLADTGVTPAPIEFFQEWEHSFLVMEFAQGASLTTYRAFESFSILLVTEPSAAQIRRFCEDFLEISRLIVDAVRKIHAKGVVINDLAPQNILFDPEQRKVTFIDFEAAYYGPEGHPGLVVPLRTIGFGAGRGAHVTPTVAHDWLALSSVLGDILYPVTPFFANAPWLRQPILERVALEKGIPHAFLRLILGVSEGPERFESLFADAKRSLDEIRTPEPVAPLRKEDNLRTLLDGISGYIVDQIVRADDPLDLPTDYRRFVTNPLSVAYGASGIALFLQRAKGGVPAPFLDAFVRRASDIGLDTYTPGLYVGTSGVAWALLELGQRERAEALMDLASTSPLLFENADLFYGAAGWGLANLFFFHRLRDEKYLHHAERTFAHITGMLKETEHGYCYINMGDVCHGLAHGASGIGYFLLRLHQVTKKDEHLAYARRLLEFELASAEERDGHVVFRRGEREPVNTPYWRVGAAGIGSIALRFHEVLGDEAYLTMARKIAHYLTGKFAVFPTNFSGMGGIASFFVDLHRCTGEARYRDEALRYLDRIMLFALEKQAGIVFPGEELIRISTDLGTGSAGTGVLVHRLLTGSGVPFLDF